jgi:NAD+ diphosphatase
MIQDIAPHIFNNHYNCPYNISPDDLIFHFKENKLLLIRTGDEPEIPSRKNLQLTLNTKSVFLFSINNQNCYWVEDIPGFTTDNYLFEEINFFRTLKRKEVAWICIVGTQLMTWYSQNQFCGRCGNKTTIQTNERAITCPQCNLTVYPRISPAIIVAITAGDKILLARGKNFRANFYSLVAGYADIGESLEDTVVREVKEEVGIDVKNIRYYKSQPWPFSGSMMIGYWAEADPNQPVVIDESEIVEADWYTRGSLPNRPPNLSIAGEMIELFEKG